MGVMDNVESAVRGSGLRRRDQPIDLVPNRLLEPQTLGQHPRRPGPAVRLGAALLALALAGVGAGLLLVRPSRAGVVVSSSHLRVTSVDLSHWGTEPFRGTGATGASIYDERSSPARVLSDVDTASRSGFDGGELTE